MKQTAVEHLQEYLTISLGIDRMRLLFNEFEKAKAMEKEQIIEACENTIKSFELDKDKTGFFVMGGEGYYNQTFKQ